MKILWVGTRPAHEEFEKARLLVCPEIEVAFCESGERALKILGPDGYDAVVCGLDLPDMCGLTLLKEMRSKGCAVPFLLRMPSGRKEELVQAMESGAHCSIETDGDLALELKAISAQALHAIQEHRTSEFLYETSQTLVAVVRASPVPIVAIDKDGNVTMWNDASQRVFGWTEDEVLGGPPPYIPPAERAAHEELKKRVLAGESFSGMELNRIRKDGTKIIVSASTAPLLNEDGDIEGFIALLQDITAQKEAETRLGRLNRLYALMSQVNETIVRAKSKEELFKDVCRVAVEYGKLSMAWIGEIDSEAKSIRLVASHGETDIKQSDFQFPLDESNGAMPPTTRSAEIGKVVLSKDMQHDPRLKSQRPLFEKYDIGSAATVPVFVRNKTRYLMTLCARETDFFQAEGESLLDQISLDLTYALRSLELEETRKRAEALHRREARFINAILDTAGVIIVVMDRTGKIVRFNNEAERVSGYRADEVIGTLVWEKLVPPEILDEVKVVFADLARGSFPNRHENEWVCKNGSRRLISWTNTVLVESDGTVGFVIGTGIDVTEKRRIEKELTTSKERLLMITENMRDMVAQIDPGLSIVYASASYRTALGYYPEEIVGKSLISLVHPDDAAGVSERIRRALAEMGPWEAMEFRLRKADGGYVWVEALGRALAERSGKAVGGVIGARVIDERKRAEEELRRSTEEALAARRRAQTYLDFLGHDISNLITPLLTMGELIVAETPFQPTVRSYAERIVDQTRKLGKFVSHVQMLSSAEENKGRNVPVDLKELFPALERELRKSFPQIKQRINFSLPKGPVRVAGGDISKEILSCVLENAVKHSGGDGAQVEVVASRVPGDGPSAFWAIEFSDEGPGIPDEKKSQLSSQVFTLFAAKRGIASTMSFMSLMAESLGGSIIVADRVKGKPSLGTRVTVTLPAA